MEHIKFILNLVMTCVFNLFFIFMLFKADRRRSKVFSLFIISMMFWSFAVAMFYSTIQESSSLFWSKAFYWTGGLMAPSLYYYALIYKNTAPILKRTVFFIFSPYLILFYLYFLTPWMITHVVYHDGIKSLGYGPLQFISEGLLLGMFTLVVIHFSKLHKVLSGLEREHVKHIILGIVVGVSVISIPSLILPRLGRFDYLWLGPLLLSSWVFFLTCTLLLQRIVDIRVTVSNMLIFIFMGVFVVGIPLYVYYLGHHLMALLFMLVLASIGSRLFIFLSRQIEHKILEDQTLYQDALLQASTRVNQFRTQEEITHDLLTIFYDGMGLQNAAFYLMEGEFLRLKEKKGESFTLNNEIPAGAAIQAAFLDLGVFHIKAINYRKYPLLNFLQKKSSCLFVPIISNKTCIALLILGEKKNGTVFSNSDMQVLNLLANNMALALKNAQYRKEEFERLKTEDASTRRAFLDQIVSVMSHEIRNPNGVVLGQAEILHEYFVNMLKEQKADPVAEKSVKALAIITDHAEKINALLEKIRRYSQEHAIKVSPFTIESTIKNIEIFEHAILKKHPKVIIKKDIARELPQVMGDEILVEEVLINYISNAAHAVTHAKNNEPAILISVFKLNEQYVRCMITDKGYGIKSDVLKKLFHVPTTTKSTNDGTGLGLWNIRRIAEIIGGQVGIESAGEGQGTKVWIDLSVAK